MVELWRWMMVPSNRIDAAAADDTGSSRRTAGGSRLAETDSR
jgi:hypothetical protein